MTAGSPSLWRDDVRLALRAVRRHPAFSAPAILTLSLGIGFGTVLFSLLYSLVLAPLPFPGADRLVVVWQTDPHNESYEEGASYPDFEDWSRQATSFSRLGALAFAEMSQRVGTEPPRRVDAAAVSPGFLDVLGARPLHGRLFRREDDRSGAAPVVVLSHETWRRDFRGDPSAVGRETILDGRPHEVIGVLPREIRWDSTEVWLPLLPSQGEFAESRGVHNLTVIGRLKPEVSPEEAHLEMTAIADGLAAAYPDSNRGRGARVQPLHEAFVRNTAAVLWLLFGASVVVLLLACANVAALMIARSDARARELAVRRALGADPSRLLTALLAEGLVVASLGGVFGIALAVAIFPAVLSLLPERFPGLERAELSVPALLFAAGLTTATGIVFGLASALRPARRASGTVLRRGATAGPGSGRRLLVVGQVALAFLLVVGTGLIGKSFWRLVRVDPGFQPEGVLSLELQLPDDRYPMPSFDEYPAWPEVVGFYERLLPRLEALPGVRSVALANYDPTEAGFTSQFTIPGLDVGERARDEVRIRAVSPAYLSTVGMPLLAGRPLAPADGPGAPDVLLVNQAFARRYLSGEDPLRHRVSFWGREKQIVGVTGDVRFRGPESPPEPALYLPLDQLPMDGITILLSASSPETLVEPVRELVAELEPDVALGEIRTLGQAMRDARGTRTLQLVLFVAFGSLALLLAGIGLYGVLTLWVQERSREIGVRKALGAGEGGLVQMVLGQGGRLVATGMLLGLLGSILGARVIRSFLFEVSSFDPVVYAGVALFLAALAIAAAWVPARRAAGVDPMTILRED